MWSILNIYNRCTIVNNPKKWNRNILSVVIHVASFILPFTSKLKLCSPAFTLCSARLTPLRRSVSNAVCRGRNDTDEKEIYWFWPLALEVWVKGLLYTDEAWSNFSSKKYKLVQFLTISILNSPQKWEMKLNFLSFWLG